MGPEDTKKFCALTLAQGDREVESVGVLCLNASNSVVHQQIISRGTVNQAPVYPREVAKVALLANATAVILVHNHPGGQCRASADDIELTNRMEAILESLGIHLHDHLIIAGNQCFSIVANRLID